MKTVLYDMHKSSGGKMTDFHGWEMPVQYEGIVAEHLHVRSKAGAFDVSHMGEILIKVKESREFLQYAFTADVKDSYIQKKAVYGALCNEKGGIVDDCIAYGIDPEDYLLVVNASNVDKDFTHLKGLAGNYDVSVENVSDKCSLIALQGPESKEVLQPMCNLDLSELKFFRFAKGTVNEMPCLISRTGYTGEFGYELYMENKDAESIWASLLNNPAVKPIGLGARDTLRFEACLPLYGQELSEDITPMEAGLSRFVNFDKGDFLGKEKLLEKTTRMSIGLKPESRGIPRNGFRVSYGGKDIGVVTSGGYCPSLEGTYAMCLVSKQDYEDEGFEITIRNKAVKAKRVTMPFYQKKSK